MAIIIDMPKLSDTMTVGTVANWLKAEGDTVSSGDIIAEIETDKATMELEAFDEGVLLKQIAPAGTQVAIGAPIAAIGEAGESFEIPDAPEAAPAAEEAAPAATAETTPATATEETPAAASPDSAATPSGGRIKASPLAKKLAAELGINLATVSGTGPNGRIVKADVLAAKESGPSSTATSAAAAPIALPGQLIAEDAQIPVSGMRNVIAQRLTESKQTAPHFYLQIEIDSSPLIKLRTELNQELADVPPEKGGIKFTVNDFILKATAEAIRRVPEINRSWAGTTINQYGAIALAFGVAIEDGLVTPVIRNAESKSLKQVAIEAKQLIGKARSKKLSVDEMSNSTFTVTNLGMFGVSSFYGIINTPNAGILSVGATLDKPVVNAAGEVVPGKVMTIGLSCDHRTVDGATGAMFLQALKKVIETPSLILV